MGFWQTGYLEFHEPDLGWPEKNLAVPDRVFECSQCAAAFKNPDDLAVHLFDGHVTRRPILMLRGRECGRSRLSLISHTRPNDWAFYNADSIRINGMLMGEEDARFALSSAALGVHAVVLQGERSDQKFEFSFLVAADPDLDGVDACLLDLVRGRSLSINTIEGFIAAAQPYTTAARYRDAIANYFYGVLARERSAESGLFERQGDSSYLSRFDDAVGHLGAYDRAPAEAICGLVAFHYNQFDIALRKTKSSRVAHAARRLAQLLDAAPPTGSVAAIRPTRGLDALLSDSRTERVLSWCCIPLDGTAQREVFDLESAIADEQPSDALKLRIVAAEHHLAAGDHERGRRHFSVLRSASTCETWADWYSERLSVTAG